MPGLRLSFTDGSGGYARRDTPFSGKILGDGSWNGVGAPS